MSNTQKLTIIFLVILLIGGLWSLNHFKNTNIDKPVLQIKKESQKKLIVKQYDPVPDLTEQQRIRFLNSLRININTASLEELLKIKGVGPSKAQKIIDYRNKNGGFRNISEITNISGFGEKTLKKLKDYITVGKVVQGRRTGRTTYGTKKQSKININTANADELTALPGIGPSTAQRIIEYRERYGYFKSAEDLIKVRGIGYNTLSKFKDKIETSKSRYTGSAKKRTGSTGTGKFNVNTATLYQLQKVPGITPDIAKKIIEYREKHRILRLSEIRTISGIGYKYRRFYKYLYAK